MGNYYDRLGPEIEMLPEDQKPSKDIVDRAMKIIEVFDKEGHSGGSAPFAIAGIRKAILGTIENIPEDSLSSIKCAYKTAKDCSDRELLNKLVMCGINFEPLSQLTGGDSEWSLPFSNDSDMLQNKRLGTLFKSGNVTYGIDTIIKTESFGESTSNFTGGKDALLIHFPVTAEEIPVIYLKVDNKGVPKNPHYLELKAAYTKAFKEDKMPDKEEYRKLLNNVIEAEAEVKFTPEDIVELD